MSIGASEPEAIPGTPTPVSPQVPQSGPIGPSFSLPQAGPQAQGALLPEHPPVPHGDPLPATNRGPQPLYCPAGPYTPHAPCGQHPLGAVASFTGTQVRRWQAAQVARAHADDYVIYLHEWYMGGLCPGPYGQHHLEQIAHGLAHEDYPVLIQPDPCRPEVNEVRRAEVVARLSLCGIPDAEARVVIGYPAAEGIYFPGDILRLYRALIGVGQGAGGIGTFGGLGGTFGGIGSFGTTGGLGNPTGVGLGVGYR